ncbi:gas vesicle protein [Gandjariella thermophila]|uniref:Gas vesicle protein n=1 Tax=Gandjariella thermophila TaxID=1931992 RepID=A0A4D4JDU5_9PSEU|nr:gas vesicle protein [Gandjariella thermophila]
MVELVRRASDQFRAVTGADVESVSEVDPTDDGWQLRVETVEVARIPDTTSVLASYQVRLNTDGDLISYSRVRRYARGQLDGDR